MYGKGDIFFKRNHTNSYFDICPQEKTFKPMNTLITTTINIHSIVDHKKNGQMSKDNVQDTRYKDMQMRVYRTYTLCNYAFENHLFHACRWPVKVIHSPSAPRM